MALRRELANLAESASQPKSYEGGARDPAVAERAAAGSSPAKQAVFTDGLSALRTDAAEQAKSLVRERSRNALLFAPLFAKLHLSPDQIAKFLDAEAEHSGVRIDINTAMIERHSLSTDPDAEAMKAQEEERYAQSLTALLGADGYAAYQAFDLGVYPHNVAAGIVGTALVDGVPFTADQAKKLGDLVQTQTTSKGTDWDAIEKQSREFLSPAQMEYLVNGEALGPFGLGQKAMIRLNDLITNADRDDIEKGISKPHG